MTISKINISYQNNINQKSKIIAIDGPAGAGKSTVAKLLAKKLGYLYLDTGAMYRAATLNAIKSRVNFMDSAALINAARNSRINLKRNNKGDLNVFLNSKLVNDEIRMPIVNSLVSFVAKLKPVRKIMVSLQRKIAGMQNCVVEGRDIGTVVFPKAFVKFYLDASLQVRSKRRCKELREKNIKVSLSEINNSIERRDQNDLTRKFGALRKAADAVFIDTSLLSINQVVDKLFRIVSERQLRG